jgi:hypothetical protein
MLCIIDIATRGLHRAAGRAGRGKVEVEGAEEREGRAEALIRVACSRTKALVGEETQCRAKRVGKARHSRLHQVWGTTFWGFG